MNTITQLAVWTWCDGTGHFAPTSHRARRMDNLTVTEAVPAGLALCGRIVPSAAHLGRTGPAYTMTQERWKLVDRICEECVAQIP